MSDFQSMEEWWTEQVAKLEAENAELEDQLTELREKVEVYEGRSPKTLVEIIDEYTKQKAQLTELRAMLQRWFDDCNRGGSDDFSLWDETEELLKQEQ